MTKPLFSILFHNTGCRRRKMWQNKPSCAALHCPCEQRPWQCRCGDSWSGGRGRMCPAQPGLIAQISPCNAAKSFNTQEMLLQNYPRILSVELCRGTRLVCTRVGLAAPEAGPKPITALWHKELQRYQKHLCGFFWFFMFLYVSN